MSKIKVSKKVVAVIILVAISLLSIFVVADIASSPEFHKSTIQTLDDKKMDVVALTAATSATSFAVAAIPSEATTPIANQIAQLSGYLMIVVCAIFLEKFLITLTGYITFMFLIPVSCLLFIIHIFKENEKLKKLAIKLVTFGLAIFMIIPISTRVSNIIDDTFNTKATIETAQKSSESLDVKDAGEDNAESKSSFSNWVSNAVDTIKSGTVNVLNQVKGILSSFIDAVAALIVTACIIPIAVMFFFIWIIKVIFGVTIDTEKAKGKLKLLKEKMDSKKGQVEQIPESL